MDINIVKKKNERFIRAYFDFMFDVVTFVALHISTLKTISSTMSKTFVFSVVPNLNSTNMTPFFKFQCSFTIFAFYSYNSF